MYDILFHFLFIYCFCYVAVVVVFVYKSGRNFSTRPKDACYLGVDIFNKEDEPREYESKKR